jgi:predicted phosphoribosyltransferase
VDKISLKNRLDAGRQLGEMLTGYKAGNPLVLALPRGGVPVGYEIAMKLGAPLDTIVSRKIGAPSNPEFGVGAIAPHDVIVFDDASIQTLGLQRKDLNPIIEEEKKEMNRRIDRYKSGEYSKNAESGTVILVDDGLATGVTARAAIESVRKSLNPKKIIFAAPICSHDTAEQLRELVDEVVCVGEVGNLMAIGLWYEEFNQTSDEEVIFYLEKANKSS